MSAVLVVGARSPVGRCVADLLALDGTDVLRTSRREGDGILPLDLTDPSSIERLVARLPSLAGVVVASGTVSTQQRRAFDELADVEREGWARLFRVNVEGPFFLVRALVPKLAAGANVVFVGSCDGAKQVPGPMPWSSSMGAIEAMARSLSRPLGEVGVRCNVVAPGVLDCDEDLLPKRHVEDYRRHSALGRLGRPEEVAEVVRFLVVENTYVTGQTWPVDGGL